MCARLRDGSETEVYCRQNRAAVFLYGTGAGRAVLSVLIRPWFSRLGGWVLDRKASAWLVKSFIRKNRVNMEDYPVRRYASFNDFFTRQILPGKRSFEAAENCFCAPCDGKLTLFSLEEDRHFTVKGCDYTLESLLRDEALAEEYRGGWGILLRLSVDDYHRYVYPVSGEKGENIRIPGVYHTVNPEAAARKAIYKENTREYTRIRTDRFGTVLMMEVGALLVGRIKNLHGPGPVVRGGEKGYFEYGGSSVILLLQKNCLIPDEDLLRNSFEGEETIVKMGEKIGAENLQR